MRIDIIEHPVEPLPVGLHRLFIHYAASLNSMPTIMLAEIYILTGIALFQGAHDPLSSLIMGKLTFLHE